MKLLSGLKCGLAITGLILAGCGGGNGTDGGDPQAQQETQDQQQASPELISQGEEIFMGKGLCSNCHGPDATGTQLAPDLTDDKWINIEPPVTREKIIQLVKTGVPEPVEHNAPMPPMGGASLEDQELEAVSAYVYSLSN